MCSQYLRASSSCMELEVELDTGLRAYQIPQNVLFFVRLKLLSNMRNCHVLYEAKRKKIEVETSVLGM